LPTNQPPKSAEFRIALEAVLSKAALQNRAFVDVRSGDLHREVGSYPGTNHRMPVCCDVMVATMTQRDEVLRSPPKGKGANLIIRYRLPR